MTDLPNPDPPSTELSGIILKAQSGFFTVFAEGRLIVCHLRGRLKQQRKKTDLAAIGDHVTISLLTAETGMIEAIAPRRNVLSRRAPNPMLDTEQVLVANPEQALFVFACAEPAPRLRMLDRFLILAEIAHLPAVICANKCDLVSEEAAHNLFDLYTAIGYQVLYTSAHTNQGVEELRAVTHGKLSVLAGPSGVGKSSLLNALQPGLGIKAQAVSKATSKGRHTTVHPELWPLEFGGFLADTPGLKALALWDVEPEELDGYFVEIKPLVDQCAFNDCTHLTEPGCAVRQAVEAGRIHPARYDSYCRLRRGEV